MLSLSLWELRILDFFQNFSNPIFDFIAKILSVSSGKGEIFIAISLLFLLFRPTRRVGIICLTALAIDFLMLNVTIKPMVARVRPYDLNPDAPRILSRLPHDYSFPSGHTGVAFAFATGVSPLGKKAHTLALIFAVIMGLSRLYLYVHYPTDVLAGAAIGLAAGLISLALWKRIFSRLDSRRAAGKPQDE